MSRRSAPVARIADLEALLLRDYELHGRKSTRWAKAQFRNVRAHMDEIDPARAYGATLEYAAARRRAGAAASTIRNEISVLGRALTIAARLGLIDRRPSLARPSVQNVRQGFLTTDQVRELLVQLPQPIRDATQFAYVSGWRREEVFSLRWSSVDLAAGVVRLWPGQTKNGQGRLYPFGAHPALRRMVERRTLERTSSPWVFAWSHGGRVVTFDRSWKRACREAGLGHTVFHDLRRSAVRNMERAGVPRSVAMKLTGHKTESIYRRYAITNEEDLARGVRLIASSEEEPRRGRARKEARGSDDVGGVRGTRAEGNGVEVGKEVAKKDQEKGLTADNTAVIILSVIGGISRLI